jgi:hypothetical protein
MTPLLTVTLMAVFIVAGGPATAAPAVEACWAEGEHYFEQLGSQGVDPPPFGSGGQCLGSNWGGANGHFVAYRFHLDAPLNDAVVAFRYARQSEPESRFELSLDDRHVAEVVFPPTGGWGHRADGEWRYVQVPLGNVAAGWHTLRLESLADKNNANLDGFFLATAPFDPPNEWDQIEKAPRLKLLRRDRGWLVDENLKIDDFAPVAEDFYYPPEEQQERQTLGVPALVRWEGEKAVLRSAATREERTVSVGQPAWDWLAVARTDTPKALVLERRFRRWGVFVYLDESGVVAEIRRPVGELAGIAQPLRKYPAGYLDWVRNSAADVLGERVLAQGDPSYDRVAGWLPDLTGYTFIATRDMKQKLAVDADGTIGYLTGKYGAKRVEQPPFDPGKHFPGVHPTQAKRGVLGGFLPATDYGFLDEESGRGWEQLAFATSAGAFVGLRSDGGWKAFVLDPPSEVATARFFEELLSLHRDWTRFAKSAVQAELPERRLLDSSVASLIRARITYAGDRPKYGLGHYAGDQHDAFPPTTLWTVEAELEWGLFDEARRDLEYYLHNLVKPDGTFDYYGPAVSEYGMMLERVVRYVRYTNDREWLAREHDVVDRICEHLLSVRRASLARTEVAPGTRGLLFGSPEADTREDVQFYYSGSMWAWRGLVEWGRLLSETDQWRDRGGQLLRQAAALRDDILRSVSECTITGAASPASTRHVARAGLEIQNPKSQIQNAPFVPPYPGIAQPFASMVQDTLASYTNYRYWLEMLSADFLSPESATALVEYRRQHQGELLGMTRFGGQLDDWPYANCARALLTLDRVDHYLLGHYGHLANHQMRGTFSDFEQVNIHDVAERTYRADYCVPAQLTIPLLTRWMLVFEERDADCLWLCKAAPQRWFAPGQRWSVKGAPTRWGRVSFEVEAEAEAERVVIRLTPPEREVDTIYLRVRLPSGEPIRSATANGQPAELDVARSAIALRRQAAPCEVVIEH